MKNHAMEEMERMAEAAAQEDHRRALREDVGEACKKTHQALHLVHVEFFGAVQPGELDTPAEAVEWRRDTDQALQALKASVRRLETLWVRLQTYVGETAWDVQSDSVRDDDSRSS